MQSKSPAPWQPALGGGNPLQHVAVFSGRVCSAPSASSASPSKSVAKESRVSRLADECAALAARRSSSARLC